MPFHHPMGEDVFGKVEVYFDRIQAWSKGLTHIAIAIPLGGLMIRSKKMGVPSFGAGCQGKELLCGVQHLEKSGRGVIFSNGSLVGTLGWVV